MSEIQLSYGNQYYDMFIYHIIVYLLMEHQATSKNVIQRVHSKNNPNVFEKCWIVWPITK